MNTILLKQIIAMLCVGALLTTTPSILACDETEDVFHTVFLSAFGGNDVDDVIVNDSTRIEVSIQDGDVTVRINGEEVPPERIRKEDGNIIILDEDGVEMRSFPFRVLGDDSSISIQLREIMSGVGTMKIFEDFDLRFNNLHLEMLGDLNHERQGKLLWAEAEQPVVMLGIQLGRPDQALEEHLGLIPGETTIINGLYADLPAHMAGLGPNDIIVEIDGHTPANPKVLKDILAEKNPGDTIHLIVIQEGTRNNVLVNLDPYDTERMAEAEFLGSGESVNLEFQALNPPLNSNIINLLPGLHGEHGEWDILIEPDDHTIFWLGNLEHNLFGNHGIIQRIPPFELEPGLSIRDKINILKTQITELQEQVDRLLEEEATIEDEMTADSP